MYNSIKMLYKIGRIDKNGVRGAVEKGYITEEQYKEIVGEDTIAV